MATLRGGGGSRIFLSGTSFLSLHGLGRTAGVTHLLSVLSVLVDVGWVVDLGFVFLQAERVPS